ncbi:mitochondrial inner membrane protease ATP23 homolog [Ischnura elegans]|uniref:mitochondrial inner membrane protease ATP23 homolog n=1 Tax=Ischnura elegans TaxID=197161 RepID=UPI001ED88775|nr:mitochondrial inner membrane protease ATP23 homolog [Ischnura elegans]
MGKSSDSDDVEKLLGIDNSSAPKTYNEVPPVNNETASSKEKISDNSSVKSERVEEKQWGYDLYPERRGQKYQPSWMSIFFRGEGRENVDKIKCERRAYSCVKNSPIVKLMMGALNRAGCPIDIRRHIACEVCDVSVSGGYDPLLNQVVICQNVARSEGMVQSVLTHEMIHMFDWCTRNFDFTNIDHLACSEVRAANLTHCSFLSAWTQGDASPFRISQQHRECVMTKAVQSVLAVRKVSESEAVAAVDRVFNRCYADMEPIGRRCRRNSTDMQRAYVEGVHLFGYHDD